ncbi:MAG: AAA family ATPase [Candidatus Thiodiazotropha sp. (ex Lucinoma kastoroae)]|nr:AAA family ATPase [Candidatus Thiodiazotropha sp. (ex Rostrolucina anterorostrata)]MCU7848352.1 AAA family ATPase [Candidatus Thiodiazotropha sp. (ex Lucinoma kastoroae)]MCU7861142.1 AAA family ATPase [Candidatus Thiodiazotropha sp. (ex Lucinoma kastoroae)]
MEQQNPHLHRIALNGFKSIKQLDLQMNPINILIGANGSGKSNFISVFTLLRNLSEGRLQNYIEKQGFASTFFHFSPKRTAKISIDIEVGENGYHVEFTHGSNDSLVFEREYCTYSGSPRQWGIQGKLGESGLLPDSKTTSEYVRKYTREYMQECRVYHFHDTGPTAGYKQAQELGLSAFLYSDASNLAPYLYYLKNNFQSSYQEIVATIQTVAPFFHDFYLQPQGQEGGQSLMLRWQHRDHDTPFSTNQLSDGTARFICLAVLFLQPLASRPKTIVLDEPELGLHPAALDVLAEIIQSVSKNNQVICSTQSVAFANLFEPEDFIVVDQEHGVSTFRRLERKSLKHWLEEYGMGEIWTKNLIGGRPEW